MSLRASLTVIGRVKPLQSPVSRRFVGGTSTPPHTKNSPDLRWIIGSVVVIVPVAYYLVGKSALKHGDNIAHEAQNKPITERVPSDSSGDPLRKISKDELNDSINKGLVSDAPKIAKKNEESAGTQVSGISSQELSDSIDKALKSDAPKTAKLAEEKFAKSR